MALPDDEQRRLGEIERELAEQDPQLARRFARRQPMTAGTLAALLSGALLLLASGIILIVMGVRLGVPAVVMIGVVLALVLPAMVWTRRR